MTLLLPADLVAEIRRLAESAYPEEGAGLLIGRIEVGDRRRVSRLRPLRNRWPEGERSRRYQVDPLDLLAAEDSAERDQLVVLGVFHSHPDHPARPSGFDLERALPFYSYLITHVSQEGAGEMRSWRLAETRDAFDPEPLETPLPQEER